MLLVLTTQPAQTGLPGAAFTTQPVGEARTPAGVLVSAFVGVVTATIATGSGAIVGTATATAVGGQFTFANLGIDGADMYTVSFSAPGLTSATSSSFGIGASSTMVAALGGVSHIVFSFGSRDTNHVASGAGVVTQIDDIRGSAFGITPMIAFGSPKPSIASGVITFDGSQNGMSTSTADFNPRGAHCDIGVFAAGPGFGIATQSDGGTYNGFQGVGGNVSFQNQIATATPTSTTTHRLVMFNQGTTNYYGAATPTTIEDAGNVYGSISANQYGFNSSTVNVAQHLLLGGLRPDFALSYAGKWQFWMRVDHPISNTEYAAVITYLAAVGYTYTEDTTKAKGLWCRGNSITFGVSTAGGANSYPSQLLALSGMSAYEGNNGGCPSRNGTTENLSMWNFLPSLLNNKTRVIFIEWELTNDIDGLGLTGAQAAQNVINQCIAAKAANSNVRTMAVACLPRTSRSGSALAAVAAANAILAALPTGVDCYAAVNLISQMTDPTNTTYYQDGLHPTTAGNTALVNDPTYGFFAVLTAAGIL